MQALENGENPSRSARRQSCRSRFFRERITLKIRFTGLGSGRSPNCQW